MLCAATSQPNAACPPRFSDLARVVRSGSENGESEGFSLEIGEAEAASPRKCGINSSYVGVVRINAQRWGKKVITHLWPGRSGTFGYRFQCDQHITNKLWPSQIEITKISSANIPIEHMEPSSKNRFCHPEVSFFSHRKMISNPPAKYKVGKTMP